MNIVYDLISINKMLSNSNYSPIKIGHDWDIFSGNLSQVTYLWNAC